jgi:hypothetical protein
MLCCGSGSTELVEGAPPPPEGMMDRRRIIAATYDPSSTTAGTTTTPPAAAILPDQQRNKLFHGSSHGRGLPSGDDDHNNDDDACWERIAKTSTTEQETSIADEEMMIIEEAKSAHRRKVQRTTEAMEVDSLPQATPPVQEPEKKRDDDGDDDYDFDTRTTHHQQLLAEQSQSPHVTNNKHQRNGKIPPAAMVETVDYSTTLDNTSTTERTRPTRAKTDKVVQAVQQPVQDNSSERSWSFLSVLTGPSSTAKMDPPMMSLECRRIMATLQQDNFALGEELDRVRHQAYHESARLQHENEGLRGELDRLRHHELHLARQESTNLRTELLRVEQERRDAVHAQQQLLHSIQGLVVDRSTSKTIAGGFPAGDTIISQWDEYGDDSFYFFKDLSRAYAETHPSIDPLLAVDKVLSMIQSLFVYMKRVGHNIVRDKEAQFATFMGHEVLYLSEPPNNTLAHLLWQSTMQKYIQSLIHNDLNGLFQLDEATWTAMNFTGLLFDDGMIGPSSLVGFCKSLLYLQLVCRCSQPRCYLFPDIGATEPLDSKHHKQVYLGLEGETKAKEGEPVKVLFPGLYFVNPENGTEKPMVYALVAQTTKNDTPSTIEF